MRKWLIFPGSVIADMFASAPDTKTRKLNNFTDIKGGAAQNVLLSGKFKQWLNIT